MAWGTKTTEDYLSGVGAETGGLEFYNRDLIVANTRTTWGWEAEQTIATGGLADISTRTVRLPSWFLTGAEIKLRFRAWSLSGVGTYEFRIRETGVPRNGTTLAAFTLTATATAYEVVGLTAPDDTWAGTLKTLALQANEVTTGTGYVNLEDLALNLQLGAV